MHNMSSSEMSVFKVFCCLRIIGTVCAFRVLIKGSLESMARGQWYFCKDENSSRRVWKGQHFVEGLVAGSATEKKTLRH